ncbi:MAG: sigma-54-dependent transcriptional regulator [Armatimonadota bacterium]
MKGVLLVVDDERIVRESLHDIFEMDGYTVYTAVDGEDALRRLEQVPVDLVVTDITMPGMDGIQLLKSIRVVSEHLPVIIITGNPSSHTTLEALRYGASDYITKPFSSREVLASVDRALLRSRLFDEEAQWSLDVKAFLQGACEQTPLEGSGIAAKIKPVISWTAPLGSMEDVGEYLIREVAGVFEADGCALYLPAREGGYRLIAESGCCKVPPRFDDFDAGFDKAVGPQNPVSLGRFGGLHRWVVPLSVRESRTGLLILCGGQEWWGLTEEAFRLVVRKAACILARARLCETLPGL